MLLATVVWRTDSHWLLRETRSKRCMAVTGRSPNSCPARVLDQQSCTKLAHRGTSGNRQVALRGGPLSGCEDRCREAVWRDGRQPGVGDRLDQRARVLLGAGRALGEGDVVDVDARLQGLQ